MKKFYILIASLFVVAAAFGCGIFLTGCGHKHVYENWITVEEATCTQEGLEKATCSCGKEETRKIDALGHDYDEWIEDKAATCSEEGSHHRICKRDSSHIDTQAISKIPHTIVNDEYLAPTCEDTGLTAGTHCSVCSAIIVKQEEIAALGHDYDYDHPIANDDNTHTYKCKRNENHTKVEACDLSITHHEDATCTTDAYTTQSCVVCTNFIKLVDEGSALGHDFGSLENDGWVFDDETHYHKKECIRCEYFDEQPCQFQVTNTVEATCDQAGYTVHTCDVCKGVYNGEFTELAQHDWQAWQACEDTTKAEDDPARYYHKRVCNNFASHVEESPCAYTPHTTDSTCTDGGYTTYNCNTCSNSYIGDRTLPDGHAYSLYEHVKGTHTHKRVCATCSDEDIQQCEFDEEVVPPTCTTQGYTKKTCKCETCTNEFITDQQDALEHKYPTTWQIDLQTGEHYRVCERDGCGSEERASHTETTRVVDPTCTDQGYTIHTCDICGHTYNDTIKDALKHDWNTWETTTETHSHTCKRENCEYHNSALIENHKYTKNNHCDDCGYDGLIYEKVDDYYIVANDKAVANVETIIVADKIGEDYVKKIKKDAFQSNTKMKNITLPQHLEVIEELAFYFCTSLESVTIPDTVTSIERNAFDKCYSLGTITMNDNVVNLGENAFNETRFVATAKVGDNVKYLGNHLIVAPSSLNGEYEILAETLTISSFAFQNCKDLTEIKIPSTVTKIYSYAFEGCDALTVVDYLGTFQGWLSIKFYTKSSPMQNQNTKLHIEGATGKLDLSGLQFTEIPDGTFRGDSITEVILPNGVLRIGAEAFEDCSQLTSVTIPETVKYIGKDAFAGTKIMDKQSGYWQNGLLYINDHLIKADNEAISPTIILKANTRTISAEAFKDCTDLKEITFVETLQYIGQHAFINSGLERATIDFDSSWATTNTGGAYRILNISEEGTSAYLLNPITLAQNLKNSLSNEWVRYYK